MSQPNKEDYEFYSENQLYILLIVTRAISAIGIIPFLIIGIVYYKRRTSITITMIINIQLCFSQFIGNAGNFYPLINTKELEQSALCTIQGIQFYFASWCGIILNPYSNNLSYMPKIEIAILRFSKLKGF